MTIRVLVWGENRHEQVEPHVAEIYPDGMHDTIAAGIAREPRRPATSSTTTLDEPEHGLTEEVLAETDVLVWWGHAAHGEVEDKVVERVYQHVLAGMGLIVLHSGHWSKIFGKLMGTSCTLRWRSERDRELVWTVNPTHPIAQGVPHPIEIEQQEMYGEFFDIPVPDELIFVSSFSGGEVFRSGCTFRRGHGKIFYFSPGDQDFPVYHHKDVRKVIANGVAWAKSDRPERAVPTLAAVRDRRLLQRPGVPGSDRGACGCLSPSASSRSAPAAWAAPGYAPSPPTPTSSWPVWSTSISTSPGRRPTSTGSRRRTGGVLDRRTGRRGRRGHRRHGAARAPARERGCLAAWASGALREAAGRDGPGVPADDRGVGGEREAADGLAVPPLLPGRCRLRAAAGRLGSIGSLSCEFFKAPHFGGFRERMAEPLLIDMAIHQFDLARKLIGAEPVSVYCESYNPDWSWFDGNAAASALFTFADGTRFAFTGSWCAPGLETSWNGRWRAVGPAGTAIWDGDEPPVAELASGEPLPAVPSDDPEEIAGSLAEFVAAVRTSTVPQSEVHSNVISVAMVEAAVRSASTGTPVRIADVLESAYAEALDTVQDTRLRAVLDGWPSVLKVVGL